MHEEEREGVAAGVADEVDPVRNDGDRVGHDASHELQKYENGSDDDHDDQPPVVAGVLGLEGRKVQLVVPSEVGDALDRFHLKLQ